MQGYWLKLDDGSHGYCEGANAFDAVQIAQKLTGKKVVDIGDNRWHPTVKTLPYPAKPIIWQFDHPVYGKCPPFCYTPKECAGRTSCPQRYACSE